MADERETFIYAEVWQSRLGGHLMSAYMNGRLFFNISLITFFLSFCNIHTSIESFYSLFRSLTLRYSIMSPHTILLIAIILKVASMTCEWNFSMRWKTSLIKIWQKNSTITSEWRRKIYANVNLIVENGSVHRTVAIFNNKSKQFDVWILISHRFAIVEALDQFPDTLMLSLSWYGTLLYQLQKRDEHW